MGFNSAFKGLSMFRVLIDIFKYELESPFVSVCIVPTVQDSRIYLVSVLSLIEFTNKTDDPLPDYCVQKRNNITIWR